MQSKSSHPFVLGLLLVWLLAACEPVAEAPPPPAKVPITSEVLEAGPFQPALKLLGTVQPSSRVDVRSRMAGRLYYPPRFATGLRTGAVVVAEELLFEVEDEEARPWRVEAELHYQAAESERERAQRGFEGGFLPEAELKRRELEAELARERLAQARLKVERLRHLAPVAGVLEVAADLPPGAEVRGGELLATLVGDGQKVVEAWAASRDVRRLGPGLAARCLASGGNEVVGHGVVREVASEVDAAGTVRVVVAITTDLAMPPPGEGVELQVDLERREGVLTVPEQALILEGGVVRAFVLQTSGGNYTAELRVVMVGSRSAGRVEVRSGLEEGERVAVRGAELLADGLLAVEADAGEGK